MSDDWEREHAPYVPEEYAPGDRLARVPSDDIVFVAVILEGDAKGGMGATILLPPRWASEALVDVLSDYAEAVVGGECPRCLATAFDLGDSPVLPLATAFQGMEMIPLTMTHEPGCPVSEDAVKAMLVAEGAAL